MANPTKIAERSGRKAERRIKKGAVQTTKAWRKIQRAATSLLTTGASYQAIITQLEPLYRELAGELGVQYRLVTEDMDSLAFELHKATFTATAPTGAGLIPKPVLAAETQAILQARQTNLIVGLTRQNQAAVNSVMAQWLDPDRPLSFSDARAQLRNLTGASARQSITQMRTEAGTVFARSHRAAEIDQIEALGIKETRTPFDATRVSGKSEHTDEMLFPKDPAGPARQVINCGCTHYVDWQTLERVWVPSGNGGHDGMSGERVPL